MVKDLYSSKQMLRPLNSTFLTLIPKREGANQLEFFRPIALCNVVYKVITMLIAERIKKWLPIIILEEQGGFVNGRIFLDGMVIAIEAIHSMASSRERAMFVNLNMVRAYNRVKWIFLRNILLTFGFSSNWVSWTISCITSASFSVLLNGQPS